jgi:hypothetical protein
MLSAEMRKVADKAIKEITALIERELETIETAADAKLEGKGEFDIRDLETGEGRILEEGKKIADDLIAEAAYEAVEGKLIKKKREISEKENCEVNNCGRETKVIFSRYGLLPIRRTILKITPKEGSEGEKRAVREKPLDDFLHIKNLPFKATAGGMERCSRWGQSLTYQSAQSLFKDEFHIDITDSYIHKISDFVGKAALEEDTAAAAKWESMFKRGAGAAQMAELIPEKPSVKDTMYLMLDGSLINTRDSDWKEVKLVMFFASKDAKKRCKGETVTISKKDYAAWLGSVEEFYYFVLDAAVKNHCFDYERIIVISDGATWIRKMCEELFPHAVQILDFWHMAENVYTFARFQFKDDETKYKPWADDIIKRLRNGDEKERKAVLDELKEFADVKCPQGVCNISTYLTNNAEKIKYADYQANGWYIGSGPMESSNKTVVQKRMKQSGMRWGTEHAQRLLALRTRFDSGRWNEVSLKLQKLAA